MKKPFFMAVAFAVLSATVLLNSTSVYAQTLASDHKSYNNSYWGAPAEGPAPYSISKVITGEKAGCNNFLNPMDLFLSTDGLLYVADTGNNRIVTLKQDGTYVREYKSATGNGKSHGFNAPQGVFVTPQNEIYVADTENGCIVHMSKDGDLIRIIEKPEGAVVNNEMVYKPSRVVVDSAGRIHVVSIFVNQGILEFSPDGEFEGFLAAGKVSPNPIEVFWKKFSTEEQRKRMMDFVPIEYNNLSLDNEGFLYATMASMSDSIIMAEIAQKQGSEQGTLVRRLNMMGNDILRREGFFPAVGDVDVLDSDLQFFSSYKGISAITDVSCDSYGMFSILDQNRKKIFTYDNEGNMLYAFGGPNVASGGFITPASLVQNKSHLFVLDKAVGSITQLEKTPYGQTVFNAIELYETGKYSESAAEWKNVLKQNSNMDLAYTGIGKAMYRNGEYESAMEYFKNGNNRSWYSKAYEQHRKTLIAFWFPLLAIVLATVFVFLTAKELIVFFKDFKKGGIEPWQQ